MNDTDETIARVLALLNGLGSTVEAVADHLRASGARGIPGEECNCPVYNYLAAEGIPVRSVIDTELRLENVDRTVTLPSPVTNFIEEFDDYDNPWPELVAEVES